MYKIMDVNRKSVKDFNNERIQLRVARAEKWSTLETMNNSGRIFLR